MNRIFRHVGSIRPLKYKLYSDENSKPHQTWGKEKILYFLKNQTSPDPTFGKNKAHQNQWSKMPKKPASGLIFLFSNASEASSFRISHRALKKNHYLCEKFKNHL